ncbi:MAG: hypothetical protein B6D34_01595 [Candidatus Brocadia sp. UTAMX1]|nr:MAG: hypothetical protein B6D34_01595 [Candidatus Brocadia sp. UTAMX1]
MSDRLVDIYLKNIYLTLVCFFVTLMRKNISDSLEVGWRFVFFCRFGQILSGLYVWFSSLGEIAVAYQAGILQIFWMGKGAAHYLNSCVLINIFV